MDDEEIAAAYVRYYRDGAETDEWAPSELSQVAIHNPERAWRIVGLINATQVEGDSWRDFLHAIVANDVEDLIAGDEELMLPIILCAAENDPVLRNQLAGIYETSISPAAWAQIRALLAQHNERPRNPIDRSLR
jgi:hypothetical protein